MQFSRQLKASAWDLRSPRRPKGTAGRCNGFSGTNDAHRLLPLQVEQHEHPEKELQATNGRMLKLLLGGDRTSYAVLSPAMTAPSPLGGGGGEAPADVGAAAQQPRWQTLVKLCMCATQHTAVFLLRGGRADTEFDFRFCSTTFCSLVLLAWRRQ